MGVMCSICQHPQVAMIDAALTAQPPQALAKIARNFKITGTALRRHERNHLVVTAPAGTPPTGWQPPTGASWKEKMEALASALEQGKVRSDVAAQLRLTYKDLDDAGDGGPIEVEMKDVPGLAEFFGELFMVLEKWPQAREAFGTLLRKHGLIDG